MRHLGPLALFAALTAAWTWPLVLHLTDAIPGGPGDNYSFVWNLWWMRHVLDTPGLPYFHTSYLFSPFGTTIADHPHTALPAIVGATVLRTASPAAAQNLLLLAYVFLNMACAYALVWDVLSTPIDAEHAEHAEQNAFSGFREFSVVRRSAVLGAVVFGLSPYLASHLLGHFDLMAAWVLPLFALCVRRAMNSGSKAAAAAAGLVLTATAYTAYYYVVYLGFFLAVYLVGWLGWAPIGWTRRLPTPALRRARWALAGLAILLAAIALWIVVTGGGIMQTSTAAGSIVISLRTPQNALTGIWLCAILYAASVWQPTLTRVPFPAQRARQAITAGAIVSIVFVAGAAPLLWQAAVLVVRGEYVSPAYQWRSAPRGVDLLAPLLGPPLHPLAPAVDRLYTALRLDRIEAVGWVGLVPLLLVGAGLAGRQRTGGELRLWRFVAAAFAIWALGPILTIGGFDTGLKLPAILLRYVPFVANARMPGRAIVGVFMALAVLAGQAFVEPRRWWRAPAVQWLLVGLVVFEYWDAPLLMTPIDRPAVYTALAAAPPGAACEVPLGIGDGLSTGIGSQERAALYYATVHGHPLVGGYIGRMPFDAQRRYEAMPVAGSLLRLSDGRPDAAGAATEGGPCSFLIVNRAAITAPLRAYLDRLPLERLASDDARDLYRVNSKTAR